MAASRTNKSSSKKRKRQSSHSYFLRSLGGAPSLSLDDKLESRRPNNPYISKIKTIMIKEKKSMQPHADKNLVVPIQPPEQIEIKVEPEQKALPEQVQQKMEFIAEEQKESLQQNKVISSDPPSVQVQLEIKNEINPPVTVEQQDQKLEFIAYDQPITPARVEQKLELIVSDQLAAPAQAIEFIPQELPVPISHMPMQENIKPMQIAVEVALPLQENKHAPILQQQNVLILPEEKQATVKQQPRQPNELLNTLCCPISSEIMKDPVFTMSGHTYDRVNIENWFARHKTDPLTNQPLANTSLVTNYALKSIIELFTNFSADPQKSRQELVAEQKIISAILQPLEKYAFAAGIHAFTKSHQSEAKNLLIKLRTEFIILNRCEPQELQEKISVISKMIEESKPKKKKGDYYKSLLQVENNMKHQYQENKVNVFCHSQCPNA